MPEGINNHISPETQDTPTITLSHQKTSPHWWRQGKSSPSQQHQGGRHHQEPTEDLVLPHPNYLSKKRRGRKGKKGKCSPYEGWSSQDAARASTRPEWRAKKSQRVDATSPSEANGRVRDNNKPSPADGEWQKKKPRRRWRGEQNKGSGSQILRWREKIPTQERWREALPAGEAAAIKPSTHEPWGWRQRMPQRSSLH